MPAGVNYDLWLGPAPSRPFNENHFHYNWHWFWEYGTGDLGNTAVHSLDVTRWLLGKREHPRSIHCIGGLHEAGAPTDQVTPNTQSVTYQYTDGTELHCDLRNWYSGPPEAQGIYIFGSKGWMKFGDDSAQVFFGRKNEPGPTFVADEKRDSGQSHFENFIDCLRSRKSENLRAPIEEGHFSTTLCHLGNISYQGGPFGELRWRSRAVRTRRRGRQASRSHVSGAVSTPEDVAIPEMGDERQAEEDLDRLPTDRSS